MYHQPTEFEGANIELPKALEPTIFPSTIWKEIRSWATTLLVLGVISIFASGFLSAPWGVLLIIVGLASFYFRSSAIMVVYAVTLAWAALSNVMSGQIFWIGFAIFQGYLVFRVFQKFIAFRRAEANFSEQEIDTYELTPQRSASVFPWAAGIFGISSLLGLIGVFVAAITFVVVTNSQAIPPFITFLEGLVVNFGVLSLAVGLASVLSKHPRKAIAIVGLVTGILTMLLELVLMLI